MKKRKQPEIYKIFQKKEKLKPRIHFDKCPAACDGWKLIKHKFCTDCTIKGFNHVDYHIFNLECYCGVLVNKYNTDRLGWKHDSCDQKFHKLDKGITI